jgi:hypothetical protein
LFFVHCSLLALVWQLQRKNIIQSGWRILILEDLKKPKDGLTARSSQTEPWLPQHITWGASLLKDKDLMKP